MKVKLWPIIRHFRAFRLMFLYARRVRLHGFTIEEFEAQTPNVMFLISKDRDKARRVWEGLE